MHFVLLTTASRVMALDSEIILLAIRYWHSYLSLHQQLFPFCRSSLLLPFFSSHDPWKRGESCRIAIASRRARGRYDSSRIRSTCHEVLYLPRGMCAAEALVLYRGASNGYLSLDCLLEMTSRLVME